VFINYDENDHVYGIPIMDYQGSSRCPPTTGGPVTPTTGPQGSPLWLSL